MAKLDQGAKERGLIEVVRAAVAACSRIGDSDARPVHTARLNSFVAKYGIDSDSVESGLRALALIKELHSLPNGFWLPAPLRLVPIGAHVVVLSPQPSESLTANLRVFGGPGIARMAEDLKRTDIPTEPLGAWIDAPSDTVGWAHRKFEAADAGAQSFIGDLPARALLPTGKDGRFSWQPASLPSDLPIDRRWYLCESINPRLPMLLRRTSSSDTEEFNCSWSEARRLRYAIPAMYGKPLRMKFDRQAGVVHTFAGALPTPERRLMTAIADVEIDGSRMAYKFRAWLSAVAEDTLRRLGLSEEER